MQFTALSVLWAHGNGLCVQWGSVASTALGMTGPDKCTHRCNDVEYCAQFEQFAAGMAERTPPMVVGRRKERTCTAHAEIT